MTNSKHVTAAAANTTATYEAPRIDHPIDTSVVLTAKAPSIVAGKATFDRRPKRLVSGSMRHLYGLANVIRRAKLFSVAQFSPKFCNHLSGFGNLFF